MSTYLRYENRLPLYILAYRTLCSIDGYVSDSDVTLQPWDMRAEPGQWWWDVWQDAIKKVNALIDSVSADTHVPPDAPTGPTAVLTVYLTPKLEPLEGTTAALITAQTFTPGLGVLSSTDMYQCRACGVQVEASRNRCYVHCGHEGDNFGSTCNYCDLCGLSRWRRAQSGGASPVIVDVLSGRPITGEANLYAIYCSLLQHSFYAADAGA